MTSERTLLKNLGAWLGKLTLANNRPVLQARGPGRGLEWAGRRQRGAWLSMRACAGWLSS